VQHSVSTPLAALICGIVAILVSAPAQAAGPRLGTAVVPIDAAIVLAADPPRRADPRPHPNRYPPYTSRDRDSYHFYFYNPYYSYSPHYSYSPNAYGQSRVIFLYCSSGVCFGT
jgi:hypothetical protein